MFRIFKWVLILIFIIGLSLFHPQVRLAFSIGTGLGLSTIQKKINDIQTRAIRNKITEADREFLSSFYRTMAYGAGSLIILGESARLMHHYLDGTGEKTTIDRSLFTESPRVIKRMRSIRRNLKQICSEGAKEVSEKFDMGHIRPIDAVFALYLGTIEGQIQKGNRGKVIRWTAKMPWKWPTYETIKNKYGSYYKEIYPIPNALALAGLGPKLWLPNALGGELEKQGLAKFFQTETI